MQSVHHPYHIYNEKMPAWIIRSWKLYIYVESCLHWYLSLLDFNIKRIGLGSIFATIKQRLFVNPSKCRDQQRANYAELCRDRTGSFSLKAPIGAIKTVSGYVKTDIRNMLRMRKEETHGSEDPLIDGEIVGGSDPQRVGRDLRLKDLHLMPYLRTQTSSALLRYLFQQWFSLLKRTKWIDNESVWWFVPNFKQITKGFSEASGRRGRGEECIQLVIFWGNY